MIQYKQELNWGHDTLGTKDLRSTVNIKTRDIDKSWVTATNLALSQIILYPERNYQLFINLPSHHLHQWN